jgi:hypothetical protein
MWADWDAPALRGKHEIARPYLRFDDGIWDELIPAMRDAGVTSVLLELGDGVRYESHPEIAVPGAAARLMQPRRAGWRERPPTSS